MMRRNLALVSASSKGSHHLETAKSNLETKQDSECLSDTTSLLANGGGCLPRCDSPLVDVSICSPPPPLFEENGGLNVAAADISPKTLEMIQVTILSGILGDKKMDNKLMYIVLHPGFR